MIIALDGAKGAGKSSVSDILATHLKNAVQLSLDVERRKLLSQKNDRAELNNEAFKNLLIKARESLKDGRNIIIDSGLTEERVHILDDLALDAKVELYKFYLKAHHDILLDRVRLRDSAYDKETDTKRFDETFIITTSKDFNDFIKIETDALSLEGVAAVILEAIRK
jgi:predicted kinase